MSRAWMVEPEQGSKPAGAATRNWNGEYYFSFGADESRSWEEAVEYGFVSAGGGSWYTGTMRNLEPGNRIWVNIPHEGYVGVGVVVEEVVPAADASLTVDGKEIRFFDAPLTADYHRTAPAEKAEHILKVDWLKTLPRDKAVSEYGFFGNQHTVCRPKADKWEFTVKRLKEIWGIE